jgi:hypothetical protein
MFDPSDYDGVTFESERRERDEERELLRAQIAARRQVCLVVDFIYPPIPTRAFDWCVYEDGREEAMEYGYGATREAAVADYFEQYGEEEDEPLAIAAAAPYRVIEFVDDSWLRTPSVGQQLAGLAGRERRAA